MVFLFVLIAFLLLVLVSSFVIYKKVFYTPLPRQNDISIIYKGEQHKRYGEETLSLTRKLAERECEFVSIKSRDALKLEGRYYHSSDGAPVIICCHGYRGMAVRDFCAPADTLFSMNLNVLLISQRGCMGSEGHTVTFGIKEREDLMEWVKYIRGRFGNDTPLYLMGVSMGAYTVLSVSSSLRGTNLRGIIADCPYSSSWGIINKVIRSAHIPPVFLDWLVELTTLLWGGFRLQKRGAIEEVAKSSTPILIIHGNSDKLVPSSMSEDIRRSNPEKVTLSIYSGADHAMSAFVERERYMKEVESFILRTE